MSSNLPCEPPWRLSPVPSLAGQSLAQWLAHELRNPLAPIATAAELLIVQAPDEQCRQLGHIIERHTQQLRCLIDELVDTAGRSRTPPNPWDEALPSAHQDTEQLPLLFDGGLAPSAQAVADGLETSALRILVVDDNADAADLLGQFLQSLGHEVLAVTDPLAALAAAASFEPQVGLLDIAMPSMDGHELARRLLRLPFEADLHLAALTAYSQPSDRQTAAQAGFEQYFVKPLDVVGLQDWLAQLGLRVCT